MHKFASESLNEIHKLMTLIIWLFYAHAVYTLSQTHMNDELDNSSTQVKYYA
jgi:hypothetical protein